MINIQTRHGIGKHCTIAVLLIAAALSGYGAKHREARVPQDVPELMTTFSGKKIFSVEEWERVRVPELMEKFQSEEYGRRPVGRPTDLSFASEAPAEDYLNGKAILKRIRVSYSGKYGKGGFSFQAVIPKCSHPVPSFVHFLTEKQRKRHVDFTRKKKSEAWPVEEIIARGYASIVFSSGEIAPDRRNAGKEGVFSCFADVSKERPMDAWGALSAWSWAASRVMDWIETEPLLNENRVAVIGHSRGGKTAILAGVMDRRFAMVCSNDSGCSGAKLNHINLPKSESIARITRVFPHWFCKNYLKYVGKEMEMDFDQHQLLALIAPRLLCVGSGTKDLWAGPRGEWWAAKLASPAWELYGRKGLVGSAMPKPENPQQKGSVSYHLRTGPHGLMAYDWKVYMDFADLHGWGRNVKITAP